MIYFPCREGSILFCPNCKNEMIIVEREKIELVYCMECNGLWFDNAEWNLLAERLSLRIGKTIASLYDIPKAAIKTKHRYCPCCGAPMEKFLAYNVVLDRCPYRHGVWFDKGELSKLFNKGSANTTGTPIEFLGEVFITNE